MTWIRSGLTGIRSRRSPVSARSSVPGAAFGRAARRGRSRSRRSRRASSASRSGSRPNPTSAFWWPCPYGKTSRWTRRKMASRWGRAVSACSCAVGRCASNSSGTGRSCSNRRPTAPSANSCDCPVRPHGRGLARGAGARKRRGSVRSRREMGATRSSRPAVALRVEDALGVNAEASYKNTPFAWSPRGWGLFVHTAATVTHGVGHPCWSHRSYLLEVEDSLDLFLIAGGGPPRSSSATPGSPAGHRSAALEPRRLVLARVLQGCGRGARHRAQAACPEHPRRRHPPRRAGLAGQPHALPLRVRPGTLPRPEGCPRRAARAELQGLIFAISESWRSTLFAAGGGRACESAQPTTPSWRHG